MEHQQWNAVLRVVGDALNSPISSTELLERAARALVENLDLKGCHFRLLSQDRRTLDHVAAWGLSQRFLDKGPVDAERSVTGALEGETVVVSDCAGDPRIQYPEAFAEEGITAMATVPLATRGQVVGVMRVFAAGQRQFTADELDFLALVALYCTGAVVRGMFHQIVQHVSEAIQSTLDLDRVLATIVEVVTRDLRARGCALRLLDSKSGTLEPRASFGLSEAYVAKVSADPGPVVTGVLEGRPVAILDARTDSRIKYTREVIQEGVSSILYVPLSVRAEVTGVLSLYTHRPYEFSSEEIHLMVSIGEQCALAIRNARMFAALKRQYDNVVDDFQMWFEHVHSRPNH